ncbi:MAG: 50S ribosomal protein L11 methyltransferase [Pyrinomonadaceae bacterium]
MVKPGSEQSTATWFAVDVDLEPEAREAVEYALMEAGALGTETCEARERVRVSGYFAGIPDRETIRSQLHEAIRIYQLPTSAVCDMDLRSVANRDWLAEWKQSWQPVAVGRFVIAPAWSEVPTDNNRIIIRIEPGMAFGTGTHETTRLCLKAIEENFAGGGFLDVGTGTGILAIAAAKLFPAATIFACDTDLDAIAIAKDNAAANGVGNRIDFRIGSVDETARSADFVCANLSADVIQPLLPALLNITCGRLVVSGILESQLDTITTRLHELGVDAYAAMNDGEWVAILI